MRRLAFRSLALLCACGVLVACGSESSSSHTDAASTTGMSGPASGSGGATSTGTGGQSSVTTGAGGAQGAIPDPGSGDEFDNNVGDVEPNDTPEQATPLGTAAGPDLYTWVNGNSIGGTDTADYFVFQSGPMPGEFVLGSSGLCWGPPLTSLTATLWKVENAQQVMPPIHTWTNSVNNCLMSMMGDAPVEANTVYLLGVFGMGGVGTYGA
jgi:hypothetical protein